ncbi:hypothetical protein PFISCL1PPCAC_5326, partial [Pristionchus fissidentatus]
KMSSTLLEKEEHKDLKQSGIEESPKVVVKKPAVRNMTRFVMIHKKVPEKHACCCNTHSRVNAVGRT